jgi:hypothetical protein
MTRDAAADEPTAAPAPPPPPAPGSTTSAPDAAPATGTPAPDTSAPPADPAYGERPDRKVDPAYGEHPDADVRNFPAPRGKDFVIVSYPDRSSQNITTLAVLGGSGVVAGAIGLYFHMRYRSASDEVGADHFTGELWTPERQDLYDRAHSSSIAAGVFYGLGGGLLLATAITYIVTEPKPEKMVIHPHTSAVVAPTRGGALVGGAWSF